MEAVPGRSYNWSRPKSRPGMGVSTSSVALSSSQPRMAPPESLTVS